MPIVKNILRRGKLTKQNLDTFDVFVDEKGVVGSLATSEYFKISNVPSDFVRGNQFFQLEGSDLLKPEVELKTEILDSEGNPIFHYAKLKRLNERLTSIVVEIYEDVAPGQGKLILLGELNPERVNVPTEFLNTYNVRFSAPINIDVEKSNTQPIRFFGSPRLDVKENVKGIVKEKPQQSTYEEFTYTISGSGALSDDGVGFREFFEWIDAPNPIGFTSGSGFDDFSDNLADIKNFQSKLNSSNFNDQEKQNKKKIKSYYSVDPVPPSFIASSISNGPGVNDNKFNLTIEAGKLKLLNPHLSVNNTDFPDDEYDKPTTFETSFKVQNSTQLLISSGYKIIRKSDGKRAAVPLSSVNYELTYEQVITSKTEDPDYFRSYADITVGNLRTFSGDVYRTKIFSNPRGSIGDSELIADVVLESQQQLVDKDSLSGRENIGIFYSQSIVDNYWISSSEGVATQNDDTIVGSVILSGSVKPYDSSMTFITSQSYDLVRDEDYIVEFDGYFFKSDSNDSSGNTTPDAELEVFLSGSAISSQIQEFSLGTIDNQSTLLKNRVSGSLNGIYNTFKTHNELSIPNTKLGFRLKKGRFALQNVVLRPFADTNFNPGFFKTSVPMPQVIKRGQRYDFTAKFYDINNNEADGVLAHTTQSIIFNGPPQVIADGLDAKLSGSMLIGESLEMYGVNPAYIRSVGYNGFDSTISNNKGGFMLFSGSVGTRITASESYEGVGLEIVDAHGSVDRYLKFRTNPSQFEVVTDTFFLGQDPSVVYTGSFISGSQGNLQISSSNFSVDVDGNVTMSGFISASGGHIGNFQIVEGKISGSNITMDANTSTIFKTDQGPGSDTSAPFDQLRDEYYIDFTPTEEAPDNYYIKFGPNFMVDKDGILIASGATFQGSITASTGLIGGFTIGSASLFNGSEGSPVFFISGSANGTGFDASNVFISSSGFSVNSQGVISASSGVIGNFHLTQTDLYAGNNSLSDNATKFVIGDITDGGTPKLALGTQANNITLTTGNDGIFMDGGGNFRVGDADGNRIAFDQSDGTLIMSSSKFFLGSRADGNSFVSGSGGNLEISSSFFHLSSSGHITGSKVKFTGGKIGGWTLSNTTLTGGTITLDSAGIIEAGGLTGISDTSNTGFYVDNSGQVLIRQGTNDFIKFSGGSLEMKARSFVLDANSGDLKLDSVNKIISLNDSTFANQGIQLDYNSGSPRFYAGDGSNKFIKFDGTNVEIESEKFELDANNLEISSTQASMSLGEGKVLLKGGSTSFITIGTGGNAISASVDSSDKFISIGKSDFSEFDQSTKGFIVGDDGGVFRFEIALDAQNYMSFDGTANTLDIKTEKFLLDTDNLDIDSDNKKITITDAQGTPRERVRIGKVDTVADNYGLKIFDGTGAASDGTLLAEFSNDQNIIAGWTISTSTISSNNLILNSAGQISSQGYASNQQGFFLGMRPLSDGSVGAFLEVDEANIRGTLKTTVFEKETVNAVGGQLQISNSTTITGSKAVGASDTVIQVANASGFAAGEIILAKKFNVSGFTTEYMEIQSVAREDGGSDINFSGSLTVLRGRGQSPPSTTVSGSLGGTGQTGQTYTPGQVLVSTGKIGTGYIRLNANPNDQTTPYMDIVERTGSGVYDVELKARLGDLSGVVDTINGQAVSGFGLYTDNAFLKGGIVATYGSIGGLNMSSTDLWAGNSSLGAGGTVMVIGDITTAPKIALGGTADSMDLNTGDGIFMSSSGEFRVGDIDGDRLIFEGGNLSVTASNFGLDAGTLHISSSNNGAIALGTGGPGSQAPTQLDDFGILLKGDGSFNLQSGTYDFIRNDGGSFSLSSRNTQISGSTTFRLHGNSTDAKIRLGTSADSITATTGTGVYIDSTGKFRAGNPSAEQMYWDGSNLNVTGQITINNASAVKTQLDIDDLEAKVIITGDSVKVQHNANNFAELSGSGMSVHENGDKIAQFSSTTRIGKKTDNRIEITDTTFKLFEGTSNERINIDGNGVQIKEDANNLAEVSASGMSVFAGGTKVGQFAAITQIGDKTTEHIEISGSGLTLKDGSTQKFALQNSGVTIGTPGQSRTTITDTDISMFDGAATPIKRVELDSSGKLTLGKSTDNRVEITDSAFKLYEGSNERINIISTGVQIKEDANNFAEVSASGMSVFAGGNRVSQFASDIKLFGGSITLQGGTNDHEKLVLDNASVALYANNQKKVDINDSGISIGPGATAGSDVVGTVRVDGNAVTLFGDNTNTFTKMSSAGLEVTEDGNKKAIFGPISVIGSDGAAVTPTSTDDCIRISDGTITFFNSSTTFSEISSVGLKIFKGDATNPVSIFGTSATIGEGNTAPAGEKHQILLTTTGGSTGLTIKDGNNDVIAFIGSSAEVASRTSGDALPNAAAVRGIVTDGLTANSLEVTGSANVGGLITSGSVRNTSTGAATSVLIHAQDNSNTYFQVKTDGEVLARDNITAFTTGFTSISDKRLKTDFYPISNSLDKILKLEPTHFTWIEKQEKDIGFIAQEVEKVIPELVHETTGFEDINSDKQDDTIYKSISYDKLTIYLVDAVKELTKRVEELEERFIRK